MPKIQFTAIVKEVKCKALVSLDKGYEIRLQGEEAEMGKAMDVPADQTANVTIEWGNE